MLRQKQARGLTARVLGMVQAQYRLSQPFTTGDALRRARRTLKRTLRRDQVQNALQALANRGDLKRAARGSYLQAHPRGGAVVAQVARHVAVSEERAAAERLGPPTVREIREAIRTLARIKAYCDVLSSAAKEAGTAA